MSSNIKEHVQQLDTALSKQKDAWAAWRDAATKARFAAVMGSAISRNLRESSTWTIKESLDSNDDYTSALQAVRSEHQREALQTATQQHIAWLLKEVEKGIQGDLEGVDSNFTLSGNIADANAAVEAAKAAHEETAAELQSQLTALRTAAEQLSTRSAVLSKNRQAAQNLHTEQLAFITDKVSALNFCDKARDEVTKAMQDRKRDWAGEARSLFKNREYKGLVDERKAIEIDTLDKIKRWHEEIKEVDKNMTTLEREREEARRLFGH